MGNHFVAALLGVVMVGGGVAGCQPRACAVEPANCAAQCDEGHDDAACARAVEYRARGVAGYRHDPNGAAARAVSLCTTGRYPKTCLTYLHLINNGLVVRDAASEKAALAGACAATAKPEAGAAFEEACEAYFDRQINEASRGDATGSSRRKLVAELEKRCFEGGETKRCLTLAEVRGGGIWGEGMVRPEDALKALRFACDRGTELACERLELLRAAMAREQAAPAHE